MLFIEVWHCTFTELSLFQMYTARLGIVAAAENALMGHCCVMMRGIALMGPMNLNAVFLVLTAC